VIRCDRPASEGWRKWLYPTISLYALTPDRKRLLPVCIQCKQRPHKDNPLLLPTHGWAWRMAKAIVQSADSNYHGVVEHGTLCHIVMAATATVMHRTLADTHPLHVLLRHNMRYTEPLDLLTKKLFEPGGRTPTIQSPTVDGTLELARRGLRDFDWTLRSPPHEFADRGVDDHEVLPRYPYRDDTMPQWRAIVRFAHAYVKLYYGSNRDVAEDRELQQFIADLSSPYAGNMKGIGGAGKTEGDVKTVGALGQFIAQIIWRATSYHAVINYSVWPSQGFIPNCPMAIFAPAPTKTHGYGKEDFEALLPPRVTAFKQFDDVYVVGHLQLDKMGRYPLESFEDRRARPLISGLEAELVQEEYAIEERNENRPAPYTILLPSKVPNSVYI
jgi:arachidonate 15-lipoxygenase